MALPCTQATATRCSGSQSLETGSRVAQVEAEIAQLKEALMPRQQIGVATGLLVQRLATTPEQALTLAADNADDKHSRFAISRSSTIKDQP